MAAMSASLRPRQSRWELRAGKSAHSLRVVASCADRSLPLLAVLVSKDSTSTVTVAFCVAGVVEPVAPVDELLLEIAEVSDRPAER